MFDDSEVKNDALGSIRKMLKDGRANRLSKLGKPAVEITVVKTHDGAPDGEDPSKEGEEPKDDVPLPAEEGDEGDETDPSDEPGAGPIPAGKSNPMHDLVMKKLDQIIRPKKAK